MNLELMSSVYDFNYHISLIIDKLIEKGDIPLAKSLYTSNDRIVVYADEAELLEFESKIEAVMKLLDVKLCITEITWSFGKLVESGVIDQAACDALKKEATALRAMLEQTIEELRAQY